MKIHNLIMDSYKTQMDVEVPSTFCEKLSEEYEIDGLVKFQIKVTVIPISNDTSRNSESDSKFTFKDSKMNSQIKSFSFYNTPSSLNNGSRIQLYAKFINVTNETSIYIQFSSKALNVLDVCIKSDSKWHLITEKCVPLATFDVYFTLDVKNIPLKVLYDDDELTDFELRGDDGSVRVHKCVLAAISPVFKTMIKDDEKETRNGYMVLEGISKATLQEFKQYIYLNSLPSPVSRQILIIALRYQIPGMEIISVNNLISDLKTENVCDFLDFAVTLKSNRLKIAILERVQNGYIKVDQIKKQLNAKETQGNP